MTVIVFLYITVCLMLFAGFMMVYDVFCPLTVGLWEGNQQASKQAIEQKGKLSQIQWQGTGEGTSVRRFSNDNDSDDEAMTITTTVTMTTMMTVKTTATMLMMRRMVKQ